MFGPYYNKYHNDEVKEQIKPSDIHKDFVASMVALTIGTLFALYLLIFV